MAELQSGDPRQVGPYVLLGRLGSGGMGRVFLGRSPGGRLVAVKVVHSHLAEDATFRARFAREVAAARKVAGLYTAPVVDADLDGAAPWLVTAYVPGPPLSDAVDRHGPLPETSLAALASGLTEGLAAIHAAGVIHRDLKPSNVLLASDGPRIIDFGIASAADATALTGTGFFIGSPGYLSPEQAQGHPVGPASDIFSLGGLIVFAATGSGPFGTGDTAALLYRVVHSEPDLSRVPGTLRPLVERSLAKDPARRPLARAFLTELTAAYPAAPSLTGNWLPPDMLAEAGTPAVRPAPAQTPGAVRPEPAVATASYSPTQTSGRPAAVEPRRPASGAAWPSPGLEPPTRIPPPPRAPGKRRAPWPWVAAGSAAIVAAVIGVILALPSGSTSTPRLAARSGHGRTPAATHSTPPASSPADRPTSSPAIAQARELRLAQLRTGDCLTGDNLGLGTGNPWPDLALAVSCGQPHRGEVFFANNAYWTGGYPGDTAITNEADATCNNAYTSYVGISDAHSIYTWDNVFPNATDWSSGMRELVCVAYEGTHSAPGGALITGSIRGAAR